MGREKATDEAGVEYIVEDGYGVITEVDWPAEGKKNAKVKIDAEGLRIPVTGSANTADREDLAALLKQVHESKSRIKFRIEVHRAKGQPTDVPIDDIPATTGRFRRLEGLRLAATAGEAPGGPVANEPPAAPPAPKSGGTAADTWGYAAALGCVEHAYELLHDFHERGALPGVTPAQVSSLGAMLLGTADAAQASITGEVNRHANSHTRARGAVRSAIAAYPPPIGSDAEAVAAWLQRVGKVAAVLMQQADQLADAEVDIEGAVAVLTGTWADAEVEPPSGWSALNEDQQAEVMEWARVKGFPLNHPDVLARTESYRKTGRAA